MPLRARPTSPLRALGKGIVATYASTGNAGRVCKPDDEIVDPYRWHGLYRPAVMCKRIGAYVSVCLWAFWGWLGGVNA